MASDSSLYAAAGRLGGLKRAALMDGVTATSKARATYLESFLDGHSCKVCELVTIPADLPLPERRRRATAFHRFHLANMAYRSAQRRRRVVRDAA